MAVVSDAIYPYNKGGKEKRIFEITKRLAQRGHHVQVYSMQWWDGPRARREHGAELRGISRRYPLYVNGVRSITQALLFGLACFRLLGARFDVVEVDHMPYFPLFVVKLVALVRRKPMVAVWHEVWTRGYWHSYIGWKGWAGYLVARTSALLPDAIFAVSELTAQRLRRFAGTPRVILIPNGIEFDRADRSQATGPQSDVIFAGRLLSHKRVDLLLRALRILRDRGLTARCLVVGEGPERAHLARLARGLGLERSVLFMGHVQNDEELYGLMKSSSVLVLPSAREGFGMVVIEANACGIPAITVADPDNASRLLISQQAANGQVCQPTARALADAIQLQLAAPGCAESCRAWARRFDWETVTDGVERAYRLLAKEGV